MDNKITSDKKKGQTYSAEERDRLRNLYKNYKKARQNGIYNK